MQAAAFLTAVFHHSQKSWVLFKGMLSNGFIDPRQFLINDAASAQIQMADL